MRIRALLLALVFSISLSTLASQSHSGGKDLNPPTSDITTAQALTRLQDKMDSIDDKLSDLKENTKALLDANNRSVDLIKDFCIAILTVLLAILACITYLFFQIQNAKSEFLAYRYGLMDVGSDPERIAKRVTKRVRKRAAQEVGEKIHEQQE